MWNSFKMEDEKSKVSVKPRKRPLGKKDKKPPKRLKNNDATPKEPTEKNFVALDKSKQQEFENTMEKLPPKDAPKKVDDKMTRGVVYIGHLPHGFYEKQLRGYFSQFGTVKRIMVPRSRKTGGSRGVAYVEFACDEVAKVAASAMDNYLMFNKLLKCKFIPPEKLRPNIFRNWHKRFVKVDWNEIERRKHNRVKKKKEWVKHVEKLKMKNKKKLSKLKELGIDYTFPGFEKTESSKKEDNTPKMDTESKEKDASKKEENTKENKAESEKTESRVSSEEKSSEDRKTGPDKSLECTSKEKETEVPEKVEIPLKAVD